MMLCIPEVAGSREIGAPQRPTGSRGASGWIAKMGRSPSFLREKGESGGVSVGSKRERVYRDGNRS